MENVPPNRTPTIGTVSRMAVLGLALSWGGHDADRTTLKDGRTEQECVGCDEPSMLTPGTSLIQRTIVLRREHVRDVIVRITREQGAIRLDVDGKIYGVRDNPMAVGVRIGNVIDDIRMGHGNVHLSATGYGEASVTRAEIERVLDLLAQSDSPTVGAQVTARFTPEPGTALAAAIGTKRWWNNWKEGDDETFDVAFERKTQGTALARGD
jgi:hypothetical protein